MKPHEKICKHIFYLLIFLSLDHPKNTTTEECSSCGDSILFSVNVIIVDPGQSFLTTSQSYCDNTSTHFSHHIHSVRCCFCASCIALDSSGICCAITLVLSTHRVDMCLKSYWCKSSFLFANSGVLAYGFDTQNTLSLLFTQYSSRSHGWIEVE